jgi:hypothetical protein
MENQQAANINNNNVLSHIVIMNKLGASFFIMFLIGAMLPLVDLGGFSNKTISLYSLAEPILLMILATVGVLVYLSGISRTAGRTVSFIFVAIVIFPLLSQLYDVYDLAKSAAVRRLELGGGGFKFSDVLSDLGKMLQPFNIRHIKDVLSVGSVLLIISFIGIIGGIFSPRYKENKQIKATITGQQTELTEAVISPETESDASANTEVIKANEGAFLGKAKILVNSLLTKLIEIYKCVYQNVKPLIDSSLDKGADIICKQQSVLKRDQVKMLLVAIIVVLISFIIF